MADEDSIHPRVTASPEPGKHHLLMRIGSQESIEEQASRQYGHLATS